MPLIIGLAPISIKNCDNNPKRYFAHHFETNQHHQPRVLCILGKVGENMFLCESKRSIPTYLIDKNVYVPQLSCLFHLLTSYNVSDPFPL